MKKITAIFMALIMTLSVTACSNSGEIDLPPQNTISSTADNQGSSSTSSNANSNIGEISSQNTTSSDAESQKGSLTSLEASGNNGNISSQSIPSSTGEDPGSSLTLEVSSPAPLQSAHSSSAASQEISSVSSTASGNTQNESRPESSSSSSSVSTVEQPPAPPVESSTPEQGSKILVAFFSRTDENYGVGYIEKGNTHIIADMIADEVGADSFEIVRVTPYPKEYRACTDEASDEKAANARPALTATVSNFNDYDVIFLGYPNWWGDMPMPVYTFLESYDFSGKTVIPFCTHAGSGLSGTVRTLRSKLGGATVFDGFAIAGTTAQNDQSRAKQAVLDWLGNLDID